MTRPCSVCTSRLGGCLTFEVITRRIEDRGGGLASVNGQTRIVEGLAMPREEDEFDLSYYNSNTCWIDVEKLLAAFQLTRADLTDEAKVTEAVRTFGVEIADLRHAQGREKALGPRTGGHFPGGPIRKAVGRHDRAPGNQLPIHRRAAFARAATQGSIPPGRLAARRLGGLCRKLVRVEMMRLVWQHYWNLGDICLVNH